MKKVNKKNLEKYLKMRKKSLNTNPTFYQSIHNFFEKESKSVGYKSGKVKKFINYYKQFQYSTRIEDEYGLDFLEDHQIRVLHESLNLEMYRRLILDEDKDWVRYMVETYFSSPKTIEYLESKMMMRGI